MDKNIIEKIKADLIKEKEKIEAELSYITNEKNNKTKFPEYGEKSDENAKEMDEYTTNLATEKVLEDSLRDINASLDRIEKGTYGICKYCGKEIGEKRMLARPVASTCVECKTKLQNQS